MTAPRKPWKSGKVRKQKGKIQGLGDLVAIVAKPLAATLDQALGTDLKNCGGCASRQKSWNERFPFRNSL